MPDFSTPLQAIDSWVADGATPGASAAVWFRGEIVATRVAGSARDGVAMGEDTLFALASVSKPITAAAVVRAADMGDLALDMPVVMLVPEFGEADDPLGPDILSQLEVLRDRITIRHLLSHASGLPESVTGGRVRIREKPTLDDYIDAMCGLPVQSAPGEELRYSNPGYGILGRVLERAVGQPFNVYVHNAILEPLGLTNVATRPNSSLDDRVAVVKDAAHEGSDVASYNSAYWRSLGMPWGGFFGTASDLVRFAASFFAGQASPIDPDSRADMIVDQTGGAPGGVHSLGAIWQHGAWGLGWEVASRKRNHWTGTLRSPNTFCHWGQSGTLVWADPDRQLALAVFGNRAVRQPWPLRPPLWLELSDAIVEAADSRA